MSARAALLVALVTCMPAYARADEPSGSRFWTDAVRPHAARARELARRAELRLVASREVPPLVRIEWVRVAHIELNRAFAISPADPDVAFLRARAAAEESLLPITRNWRSLARLALARLDALREVAPDHRPQEVAFERAILLTRLGEYAEAAEEYRRARAALLDPRRGATITANLAEVTMLSGDLERAATYFEEAVQLSERDTQSELSLVLALIGGAVTYDRLGDGARALELASRARAIEGGPIRATRSPGVFFEPREEIHYYDALDALAWAAEASGDEERRALEAAATALEKFVKRSAGASRFEPRARERLNEVRDRIRAIDGRARR